MRSFEPGSLDACGSAGTIGGYVESVIFSTTSPPVRVRAGARAPIVPTVAELRDRIDGQSVDASLRDSVLLAAAAADSRGIPLLGRTAELELLRATGQRDLPLGRLYEGHMNALQLIARCGDETQRSVSEDDARAGRLFGVWNTGPADNVRLAAADAGGGMLSGRKTFCSGAGIVARAIVTAARDDGSSQMTVVPMDAVSVAIDRDSWHPMGMEASESYAVGFDGVRLPASALAGEPGAYERAPWFTGGASRFLAVQCGALERLRDEHARWLRETARDGDPIALARFAEVAVATATAMQWVAACGDAWTAYDAQPNEQRADELLLVVDSARIVIERAALDIAERVERAAGARGLLEPQPFGRLIRDLRMYLRQPAPDAAFQRVARAVLDRASL